MANNFDERAHGRKNRGPVTSAQGQSKPNVIPGRPSPSQDIRARPAGMRIKQVGVVETIKQKYALWKAKRK
jgi:hypothetical protein